MWHPAVAENNIGANIGSDVEPPTLLVHFEWSRALFYDPVQADMNCSPVAFDKYDWHDVTCNLYSNGPSIAWNPAVYCIFASSFAVTIVMALHIMFRNFKQFKKRKTIYFW